MKIDKLDWDSDFFGIKIGRLSVTNADDFDPLSFIDQVHDEKYDLVYVFKYQTMFGYDKITQAGLDLVDIQITMSKKINRYDYRDFPYDFRTGLTEKELAGCYHIAEETAIVSRFYTEKTIGPDKTRNLYRKWIDNAMKKSFSDGLFLTKEADSVTGIHLIKTDRQNNVGYFTLTGVDPDSKRMGIGRKLWEQSFGYFSNETEIEIIRSPFSFQNAESFNFHLKMGFNKLEEIKYIYHFRNISL